MPIKISPNKQPFPPTDTIWQVIMPILKMNTALHKYTSSDDPIHTRYKSTFHEQWKVFGAWIIRDMNLSPVVSSVASHKEIPRLCYMAAWWYNITGNVLQDVYNNPTDVLPQPRHDKSTGHTTRSDQISTTYVWQKCLFNGEKRNKSAH